MAGKRELGIVKASSVRELANNITLRNVRCQGHEYVELREDGKRHIFFCILCLSPCYSEDSLFGHLKGNLHKERYAAAKVTLLLPNRWPFNDGVLFFHNYADQDNRPVISSQNKDGFLLSDKNSNLYRRMNLSSSEDYLRRVPSSNGIHLNGNSRNHNLSIPGVVIRDEISVLDVSFRGFGDISARICEFDEEFSNWIRRIWCAWLGKEKKENLVDMVPDHDFAVITFPYTYDLGRSGIYDNLSISPRSSAHTDTETGEGPRKNRKKSACSNAHTDVETVEGPRKKRRKSFSDPEDVSKCFSDQCGSSREGSVVSYGSTSEKILRRALRQQERAAAERMCDVCQRKMLPGKDMATLLNMKTGRLACSSRNVNGAFHVFHTSCLIHWILICEFEIWKSRSSNWETTRENGRENGSKCSETEVKDGKRAATVPISSVFCPECQGTGINIEGDQLQTPTVPVSQMFNHKLQASDAHRSWMKSPETLQNCSTGLRFPSQSEEMVQERVLPLKLLHFYRANA